MALTSEDIKQISDLLNATLDTKLGLLEARLESRLEAKLEAKLAPIRNDLAAIKVDLANVKLHVASINQSKTIQAGAKSG